MRLAAACTASLLALSITSEAFAADPADSKVGVGGDLQVLIPVGDLSDATGVMLGPLARGGYRIIPQLELTGRVGYLFGLSKDVGLGSTSVSVLPIWAGARYFFQEDQAPAGAYAGGELGVNILTARVSYDGLPAGSPFAGSASDTTARIGLNLAGGYVISRELPIDLRGQLSLLNLFDGNSVGIGIGLSAGYTFFVL